MLPAAPTADSIPLYNDVYNYRNNANANAATDNIDANAVTTALISKHNPFDLNLYAHNHGFSAEQSIEIYAPGHSWQATYAAGTGVFFNLGGTTLVAHNKIDAVYLLLASMASTQNYNYQSMAQYLFDHANGK